RACRPRRLQESSSLHFLHGVLRRDLEYDESAKAAERGDAEQDAIDALERRECAVTEGDEILQAREQLERVQADGREGVAYGAHVAWRDGPFGRRVDAPRREAGDDAAAAE